MSCRWHPSHFDSIEAWAHRKLRLAALRCGMVAGSLRRWLTANWRRLLRRGAAALRLQAPEHKAFESELRAARPADASKTPAGGGMASSGGGRGVEAGGSAGITAQSSKGCVQARRSTRSVVRVGPRSSLSAEAPALQSPLRQSCSRCFCHFFLGRASDCARTVDAEMSRTSFDPPTSGPLWSSDILKGPDVLVHHQQRQRPSFRGAARIYNLALSVS